MDTRKTDAPPAQHEVANGSKGNGHRPSEHSEIRGEIERDPLAARCRCDDPLARRHGPDNVCWFCRQIEMGGDGSLPEPTDDEGPALEAVRTTWAPIDVLNSEHAEPEPSMLARTDGRCLLYPGRVHALHAEPESLKSWLALKASVERLRAAEAVLYIDFETSAGEILHRLYELGADDDLIRAGFIYLRPDEPLLDAAVQDLEGALKRTPSLAVIDGVTEAFAAQGLSPLDNSDVARWLAVFPRRLVRAGAAVLSLDHVVKDREARGRYAVGAQHKLAGVDVAYSLRVVEPFARGREGVVSIKVEKDRPGRVREFATAGQVALLRASSDPDGSVTIALEPPEGASRTFRPTGYMERISLAIEATPGLSKRNIRTTVGGKTATADLALGLLIAEGFVEARLAGQKHDHHSLKPYREEDVTNRDPTVTPATRVTVESDRDPVTPPLTGGTVTAHNDGHPNGGDRDPDDELERLSEKFPELMDEAT